jgi:hypothetical protein
MSQNNSNIKSQISKFENSLPDAGLETIIKVFKALNAKIQITLDKDRFLF